nr:hypothetical protein Itr_chr02CG15840 [Ipomoea trifida]
MIYNEQSEDEDKPVEHCSAARMLSDQKTSPAHLQWNTAHDQRSKSHLQIAGQLIQNFISKSLTLFVIGPETTRPYPASTAVGCPAPSPLLP